MILTILSLFLLGFVYLTYRILSCRKELQCLPSIGLIRSLQAFFSDKPYDLAIEEFFDPILKEKKLVRAWVSGEWVVLVSSPAIAKELYMFPNKYPKNIPQDLVPNALFSRFMGVNVIFSNYDTWRRHRSVVNPPFHKQFDTKQFGEVTKSFIKLLDEEGGQNVDVFKYMQSITIDALGKVILDVEFNAIKDPDAPFLKAYNNILSNCFIPFYLIFPFFDQAWNPLRASLFKDLEWLQSFFDTILDERRKEVQEKKEKGEGSTSPAHDDLLTLMIQSQDKDSLSNKELMDNILGFFLAGHETTACVLGAALFFLAKHPEVQAKLYKEISSKLVDKDSIPTIEQTKDMPYLSAIMEESLRLYPPVSRLPDRICSEPLQFGEYTIPKGTRVALSVYSLHRDKEVWGEDANEFRPERFLEPGMSEKELKSKFILSGFGGGSRSCLGLNFSRMEQKVVLSMLINKFEVTPTNLKDQNDRLDLTPHPILYPKNLILNFNLRK